MDLAAHPSRPLDPALAEKGAVHPELYWLLDSPAQSTLADILQAAKRNAFSPWPSFWSALWMEGLPRECGTFWLRFELAPSVAPAPKTNPGEQAEADPSSPAPLVLDLNTRVFGQTPGRTQVWMAAVGASDGTQIIPVRTGLYPLPSHSNQISTIYIRTEGLPGPGFAPVVRAAAGADGGADFDLVRALFIILAVGVLFCLVRGVIERKEWRLWAALYALAVGVHAFWGLPASATDIIRTWDMPGLLAPGVALFLLPHVGRHLMRTRERAPFLDMQLVLLALPGIPLSLLPLMPGHTWTMRYLPLWPALIPLLLPTVLAACIRRLPGAGRFLLTCLAALASLAAFLPQADALLDTAGHPERMNWLSLAPLACLTASVLLLTLMRAPRHVDATRRNRANQPDRPRARSQDDLLPHNGLIAETDERRRQTDPPRLEMPTPAVRGMPPDSSLRLMPEREEPPLPLDPTWRQSPSSPVREDTRRPDAEAFQKMRAARPAGNETCRKNTFDLQELMLKTHDRFVEEANARNLALSWFTAPYLPHAYEGDRDALAEALRMLTESAVHATQHGAVHIKVQRVPESADPGHLLFTITDSGTGTPPFTRESLALVRAWEFVRRSGGTISMESGPTGTSVSFSIRLTTPAASPAPRPAERPSPSASERSPLSPHPSPYLAGRASRLAGTSDTLATPAGSPPGTFVDDIRASYAPLRIILASPAPANRRLLACYLDELPHEVREARDTEEAREIYVQSPCALLIFDDDIPEEDVIRAVAAIRLFEGERNVPLASILALSGEETKSERLLRAGCTHVLRTPVSRKELRLLALRLAPVPRSLRVAFTGEASARQDARPVPRPDGTSRAASMNAVAKQPTGSGIRPVYPAPLPVQPLPQNPTPGAPSAPGTLTTEESDSPGQRPAEATGSRTWRPVWKRTTDQTAPETPLPAPADTAADTAAEAAFPAGVAHSEQQAPHRPAARDTLPREPQMPIPRRRRSWLDILFGRRAATPKTSLSLPPADLEQSPDSVEWVGDPTPILNPTQPSDSPRPAPTPVFLAPEDAVEWVGEPVPIIEATPPDRQDRVEYRTDATDAAGTADSALSASETSRSNTPVMPISPNEIPYTADRELSAPEVRPADTYDAARPDAPYSDTLLPTEGSTDAVPVIDLTEAHLVQSSSLSGPSNPAGEPSGLPPAPPPDPDWLRKVPDLSLDPQIDTPAQPDTAQRASLVLTDRLPPAREACVAALGEQSIAELAGALRAGKQEILHGQTSADPDRIGAGAARIAAAAEGLALHTLADLAHCVAEGTRTDAADLHVLLDELLMTVDRTLREIGL